MSSTERFYALLPSVYRRRDAEQGEPLRALMAVLEEQFRAVEADIETTWDNWFVETAEEWLVPYMAQALGLPVTRNVTAIAFSRRAFVANALRYRRRKGTAGMLELLARDVTNYPTLVVEFFTRMAWNEAVNHQTSRPATIDIRSTAALERLAGPFGTAMRTAEVRRIASGRGTVNLPNLGLFMWRTQLWNVAGATAEPMSGSGGRAWWFRPFAGHRPLYAPLETERDPVAVATEASVPLPLSRRRLWDQARRLGASMVWPFSIAIEGESGGTRSSVAVPADRIDVCHLETIPAATPDDRVLVDPERGALVVGAHFTAGLSDVEVVTNHYIATPGSIGAGPWTREAAAQAWLRSWTATAEARDVGYQVLVLHGGAGPDVVPTLDAAIEGWNTFLAGLADDDARSRALGLILIGDSRTHAAPPPARVVTMPKGAVLGIVAARWPLTPDPEGGPAVRKRGDFLADEVRPVVRGALRVQGVTQNAANRGELYVNGIYLDGRIVVQAGDLQGLHVASSTLLAPQAVTINGADGANAGLDVILARSIVGEVTGTGAFASLTLVDTAVVGHVQAPLATASMTASTVLGTTAVARLEATSCLFDDLVTVEQQQDGCVRFSYVLPESRTPRRFRCQPDLAIENAGGAEADALVRVRVRPQFLSRDPNGPGFLILSDATAPEVRGAAEDGGEPGCWNHLQHGIRVANLTNALPQFLRFGLEPGIFFLV